jgi:hypothetical protein
VVAAAGFGGVGGLLFSLGEASEGRIVGRLPFRGSSAILLLDQAHGELLRLDVGGRCSGSGLGAGGAGGGGAVMAQHDRRPARTCCAVEGPVAGAARQEAGCRRAQHAQERCSVGPARRGAAWQRGEGLARVALLGREERGRRARRFSAGRKREESRSSLIS